MEVGNKTFKVHLDPYDITDALAGSAPSPRHEFFCFNDDAHLSLCVATVGRSFSLSWTLMGRGFIPNG